MKIIRIKSKFLIHHRWNRSRSAVAAASRFPAEGQAPNTAGRNCLPTSLLPLARTLSDWQLANSAWQSAVLRGCHLGPSPPRAAWTCTDYTELFMLCNYREKPNYRCTGREWRQGLPPSLEIATIRLAAIATVPGSSHWRSRHRDEAIVRRKRRHPGPPHTKAQQRNKSFYDVRLRLWRPLGDGDNPLLDVEDDDDERYVWSQSPVRRRRGEGDDSVGRMDESSQGPKRAVAEAVACLLRVQPCMYSNTIVSSYKRPVVRASAAIKLRPPPGATAVLQAVGWRRCRSPKVDGGRLHKAGPESSLARKKDLLAPPPY